MRAVPLLLVLAAALPVRAETTPETDARTFERVVHRGVPREVSVHAELRADARDPLVAPLWSGLSLRLLPLGHVDVERGVFAYSLQLLSEEGEQPIVATNQPAHGISEDVIAAFHFRNRDNSGPNAVGPLNTNAPGAHRDVRYPGVSVEIRVLSFEIVGARPGAVPAFSSLRLLLTARETDNLTR